MLTLVDCDWGIHGGLGGRDAAFGTGWVQAESVPSERQLVVA